MELTREFIVNHEALILGVPTGACVALVALIGFGPELVKALRNRLRAEEARLDQEIYRPPIEVTWTITAGWIARCGAREVSGCSSAKAARKALERALRGVKFR